MASSKPIDPLIQQATAWLLRLDASPEDPELRRAAEAWRRENHEHVRAWTHAERAFRLLAAVPMEPSPGERPFPAAYRWLGAHRAMAASIVVALGLMIMLVILSGPRADFATATAEVRQVTLDDGSTIELGAQSAIDVAYSTDKRLVTLLAGEAFFGVRPMAGRPFEVRAAGLVVTVVGTSFEIRMSAEQLSVSVAEGVVEARYAGSIDPPVRLMSGDQLSVKRSSGSYRQARLEPGEVASWRNHLLSAEDTPLREVVADLRRYSGGWIVFGDGSLGEKQVSGLYDLRDPDRALRLLVGPFGGKVRQVTPFVRVITGP